MASWRELALDAVTELSAKSAGDALDQPEEALVLRRCKAMLDSWAIKGYIFPGQGFTRTPLTIDTTKDIYTVGDGMDLDIDPTPMRLHSLNLAPTATRDSRPVIQCDLLSLERVRTKENGKVTHFYYELISNVVDVNNMPEANNYGSAQTARLHLNSKPIVGNDIQVVYHNLIPSTAALVPDDVALVPPGYERLIIYCLALELTNVFGYNEQGYNRIYAMVQELMADIVELNKGLYVAIMENMRKFPVPGTDATIRGNSPTVGPPIQRQQAR